VTEGQSANSASRRRILSELLEFNAPIDALRERLRELPWDADSDELQLLPDHVVHLLAAAKAGEVQPADVSSWAELVESREDIGMPDESDDLLREFLFEAANPEINNFGPACYQVWIERLTRQ
jgi:hypothetical protein